MEDLELKRKELERMAKEIDEKLKELEKNITEESDEEIENLEMTSTVDVDCDSDSDTNESSNTTPLKSAGSSIGRGLDELKESNVEEDSEEDEIEEEDDDYDSSIVGTEDTFNWKIAAGVGGVALAVGAGVFLAVKRPWQASKVICHLVHIV